MLALSQRVAIGWQTSAMLFQFVFVPQIIRRLFGIACKNIMNLSARLGSAPDLDGSLCVRGIAFQEVTNVKKPLLKSV